MRWLHRLLPRTAPLGSRGEAAAARFLRQHHYRILVRNVRNRAGEIDLIAEAPDRRTLVIVEVKAGEGGAVRPEVRVGAHKQRQLVRLAAQFIRKHRMADRPVRFDVIGVDLPTDGRPPAIRHYVGAFESTV